MTAGSPANPRQTLTSLGMTAKSKSKKKNKDKDKERTGTACRAPTGKNQENIKAEGLEPGLRFVLTVGVAEFFF
jgi:hypothetical protein